MGYVEFNRKRESIISKLDEYLEERCSNNVRVLVTKCIDEIQNGKFRISVFGGFSNGKSTLLNALMGFDKEVFVVDELASTAAITTIMLPDSEELTNKAKILFNNEQEILIDIDQIKDYSAKHRNSDGTSADTDVEDNVREVRAYVNSSFLANGVIITDTPGFNSTYEVHSEIARSIIKDSDATIFLFKYEQAGTGTDFDFISLLEKNLSRAFLVINKIDIAYQNKNHEQLISSVCDNLREKLKLKNVSFGDLSVYPISAKYAFEANSMPDSIARREKIEKSRFEDFTSALEMYLCSSEFENEKLFNPVNRLKRELIKLTDTDRSIINSFKEGADSIEQSIAAIEEMIEAEKKKEAELCQSVSNLVRTTFTTYRAKLSDDCDRVASDITDSIMQTKTEYAINHRIRIGGSWSQEAAELLYNHWDRFVIKLENDLISVVSDLFVANDINSDDLSQLIKEAVSVQLDKIMISDTNADGFKVDFGELDAQRRELDDLNQQLEDNLKEMAELRKKAGARDYAVRENERLRNEISRINRNIDEQITQKSQIQGYRMSQTVYTTRKREGFFGKIGDALFGEKREAQETFVTDNTDADRQRAEIQSNIDKNERALSEARHAQEEQAEIIRNTYGADQDLLQKVNERGEVRENILRLKERLEKKQDEIEDYQVAMYQEKMKSDIRNMVDNFSANTSKAMTIISLNIQNIITRLINNNNAHLDELTDKKYDLLHLQAQTESEQSIEIEKRTEELNSATGLIGLINKLADL